MDSLNTQLNTQTNSKFKINVLVRLVLTISLLILAHNIVWANEQCESKLDSIVHPIGPDDIKPYLENYFVNYTPSCKVYLPVGLDYYFVDESKKQIKIYVKEGFSSQVFTESMVAKIHDDIAKCLPSPYNLYNIVIIGHNNLELKSLIPNMFSSCVDTTRLWGKRRYTGNEWVRNISRPFSIKKGLQGTHLTVWPSHGRYFDFSKNSWAWQRPNLYCTTEDLYTYSIVAPFLIPMLENAGAVVYMPRERDMNPIEIIVDNDSNDIAQKGLYSEVSAKERFVDCEQPGFCQLNEVYYPNQNPHLDGTARMVATTDDITKTSHCVWTPIIPEDGDYALYVTYPPNQFSVPDAVYSVKHSNIVTEVRVNQQMGGNTWVYLGTFHFTKGQGPNNSVSLSNYSKHSGVVMADAIRIGGGMGNMSRNGKTSGLPRFLEGSLYYAQWAGMPFDVYNTKDGKNDYADDINVRSNSLNYLAGGSIYVPDSVGLKVPIELSLAVHSDAGVSTDNSIFGTLGICTYRGDDDAYYFNSGVSRLASHDLASVVQNEVCRDLTHQLGITWTQRELYTRNYSETRKPEVPSMILETLSHQNFEDMCYGHNPVFKFLLSRSIYKAITKYVAFQHQNDYTIQPLPVKSFAATTQGDRVMLSWTPRVDSVEPSANPTYYVVYTSKEGDDFDNGRVVKNGINMVSFPIEKDVVYRFKVSACNDGGESFPSEVLAVLSASKEEQKILVVNGFTRLDGPKIVSTANEQGFDLYSDIGVPYGRTAEYSGFQQCFDFSKINVVGPGGLGYSNEELVGKIIAGNSFDYPSIHAQAIKDRHHHYSVSSCSIDAMSDSLLSWDDYQLVDMLFGLQRETMDNRLGQHRLFDQEVKQSIDRYLTEGGKLIISGAYIASGLITAENQRFASDVMCYGLDSCVATPQSVLLGDKTFNIISSWNPHFYATKCVDVLRPCGFAEPFASYSNGGCASVATSNIIVMGFPFEGIGDLQSRAYLMKRMLHRLF